MHFINALILAITFLATTAHATLYATTPVAATVWDARQDQTVTWKGNSTAPPLELMGKVAISLWTGGVQQQTFLQCLTCGRYVAGQQKKSVVTFNTTLGPSGPYYFLRFSADALQNDIFSARFTLTHMTGSFNATVQAQLNSLNAKSLTPTSSAARTSSVSASIAINAVVPSASASASASSGSAPLCLSTLLGSVAALTLAVCWSAL